MPALRIHWAREAIRLSDVELPPGARSLRPAEATVLAVFPTRILTAQNAEVAAPKGAAHRVRGASGPQKPPERPYRRCRPRSPAEPKGPFCGAEPPRTRWSLRLFGKNSPPQLARISHRAHNSSASPPNLRLLRNSGESGGHPPHPATRTSSPRRTFLRLNTARTIKTDTTTNTTHHTIILARCARSCG